MRYFLECMYCGNKWEENYIYPSDMPKCKQCGDKNIKVRDNARDKIDYYQGSPPFPKDDDGYPWGGGN